jgi:phosphatidylinositol alpha-1,6-mannosyltransferase
MSGLLGLSESYVPHRGGHVVWMHEVCRRLLPVRLLTGRRANLPDREEIDGVEVRRINLSRVPLLRPESLVLYANFTAQAVLWGLARRPEAILASRVLPEGLVANHAARAIHAPSVVFAHGEEIACWGGEVAEDRRRARTAEMKRRSLWKTYRRADHIIANSRFTRDLLRAGGIDAGKVSVVHPGTDAKQFRPQARDEALASSLGLAGRRVGLSVGTLKARKGQDMTLRALPEVIRHVPEAVYAICGAGPAEAKLRELARSLGLGAQVRFLGKIPTEQLPALYNLADVFTMPNRRLPDSGDVEGFGIVFLEASACELPVIGGRTGGVGDAVADGESGLLVDGDSPDEIAHAIVRLLRDRGLARRLGKAGRRRVCGGLTWDHSAEGVREAIQSCRRRGRERGTTG